MAHEIIHSMLTPIGLNNCHTFDLCYNYPHADESLGPQTGIKIRPTLETRPGRGTGNVRVNGDILSYLPPRWVSPYTYCNVLQALTASAILCPDGVPSSSPQPRVENVTGRPVAPNTSLYLYVSGWVTDQDQVELAPFRIMPSDQILTSPSQGKAYMIALEDEQGVIKASYTFDEHHDHHPSESNPPTLFAAYLPWVEGTKTIAIRHNLKLIAERVRSPNVPKVKLIAPLGGGTIGGKQTIEWDASDADGDPLWFAIQYSANNGKTWMTLNHEMTEKKVEVNFKNVPGANKARLRIVATDGVNTTLDEINKPFQVAFKRPQVILSGIKDGASFGLEERFLLQATAFDWEDGAIADAKQFAWSSDLDGFLGNGRWLVPQLKSGKHTLQVVVTDSSGKQRSKKLHVTIRNK